jgi:1,4-dihydroxy-2-naphthoate octaprenyltransferase
MQMNLVAVWWKTIRGPFFTTSIVPVMLGTSVALSEGVSINLRHFLLSIAVVCSCHAGSNLFNDYYDHLSTNDDINNNRSPFNGGSGSIQEGIVGPAAVKRAGVLCYAISFFLGMVMFVPHNFWGLLFVLTGIASGYCYSKFPGMSYLGFGELMVGLSFGPLIVSSAYFVQTETVTPETVIISIPIGLLVAAVLYINQFPDYEADKAVNKRNLVVRLGLRRALPYYYFLLAMAYLVIVVGVRLKIIPDESSVVFLTMPLAVAAAFTAAKWYDNPRRLLPANAYTVVVQASVGLLLTGAFVWTVIASYLPFIH